MNGHVIKTLVDWRYWDTMRLTIVLLTVGILATSVVICRPQLAADYEAREKLANNEARIVTLEKEQTAQAALAALIRDQQQFNTVSIQALKERFLTLEDQISRLMWGVWSSVLGLLVLMIKEAIGLLVRRSNTSSA